MGIEVKQELIVIPNTTCSYAEVKLCHLQEQIHFWWYLNQKSSNNSN